MCNGKYAIIICKWVYDVCQVQVEVIQKRQKEKKAMMNAVKKYQKGGIFGFSQSLVVFFHH